MKRKKITNRISWHLFFPILFLIACKENSIPNPDPLYDYSHYREGPYVFLKNHNFELVHFDRINQIWTPDTILQNQSKDTVWVGNPTGNPFPVKLHSRAESHSEYVYPYCDMMLLISDIEGNFEALYHLLRNNGVMDEAFHWSFGSGHLVLLGDLFDRGRDVTPSLWLLYKLEQEAANTGGRLHIILGNHEIMIFNGDTRYIHPKYAKQCLETGIPYSTLFNNRSVLGKWLRNKPAIIRIKDILLTHAGISPSIFAQKWGYEEINTNVTESLAGKLSDDPTQMELLFGANGIFWYRDWVDLPPPEATLDSILDFYEANHMIIGHTIVPEITARFHQKLIQVDIHQPRSVRQGLIKALGYQKGKFYEVNHFGQRKPIKEE